MYLIYIHLFTIDIIFSSNENFTFKRLLSGKAVFIKYWSLSGYLLTLMPYNQSIIPGLKEDISASMVLGKNIGIFKNISEEKKEAALEVIKYFTSKEYQKKEFESGSCSTALTEILDDEELCKNAPCTLMKAMQILGEPKFIKEESVDYKKKYKKYIYQFLYGNKTVEETVKRINDLTKVYYVSLKNTGNTTAGLIFFIIFSIISVIMLLSLTLLFNKNFIPYFQFLSKDFWIITVLGSIIILWVPMFNYESIKTLKCHLKIFFFSIGLTLNLIPMIYKLILIFPIKNKIVVWINENKYLFLVLNILVDVVLNSISAIYPFTSKLIVVEDGENFEICNYTRNFNTFVSIGYKVLVMLILLFLIFSERNIPESMYDVKIMVPVVYFDLLSILLIIVIYVIEIKYYISFFIMLTINILIISIANFIFIYCSRLFIKYKKNDDLKIEETSKNHFKIVLSNTMSPECSDFNNTANINSTSDSS